MYCNVLEKFRLCKKEFKEVHSVFARREKNKVADHLARGSRKHDMHLNVVRVLHLPLMIVWNYWF